MSSIPKGDPIVVDGNRFTENAQPNNNPNSNNGKQQTIQIEKPPKTQWEIYLDGLSAERKALLAELAKLDEFEVEGQTLVKKKLLAKGFNELERLRAKFQKVTDEEETADALIEVYQKCALHYFGLDEATYLELPFDEMKIILDACTHRSLYGIPNSPFLSKIYLEKVKKHF